MPATGVGGLDLYVKVDSRWRWLVVGQPAKFPENAATLVHDIPPGNRESLLYLPPSNGVRSVAVEIPKQSRLERTERDAADKPIVFYATSITQGGGKSRSGRLQTAILGRWLNRSVINLGFSGKSTMDQEMTRSAGRVQCLSLRH